MAIQKRTRGGRPSKGERHVFTTRVPVHDAEKVFAIADREGRSASEFIAQAIAEKLASINIDDMPGQEGFLIPHAS